MKFEELKKISSENELKEAIMEELVSYVSGSKHPVLDELTSDDQIGNDVSRRLAEFEEDWNNAECDDEGASKEQEAYLDRLQEEYAEIIVSAVRTVYCFYTVNDIRKHTGMTRQQFSEKFGIPYRTIENWEADPDKPAHRDCPPYLVRLLATVTGYDEK